MNGETKREKKNGGRGERRKKRKKEKDVRWNRKGGEHCLPIKIRKSWGDGHRPSYDIGKLGDALIRSPFLPSPLLSLFIISKPASRW